MVSRFEDASGRVEFGTGVNPAYSIAYMKSVMEIYERYTLGCRYFDRFEKADRLGENYLDPREYVPYSGVQLEENGFTEFCADDRVEWLQGYDLEGHCVYVPADLCFYVPGKNGILYHVANSNGCAAHFDIDTAKRMAVLELIERDAIVKSWIYRQIPDKLDEKGMPDNIRQRLQQYRKDGVSLFILSLPCEYAYTVLVCSVDNVAVPYLQLAPEHHSHR